MCKNRKVERTLAWVAHKKEQLKRGGRVNEIERAMFLQQKENDRVAPLMTFHTRDSDAMEYSMLYAHFIS